MSSIISGYEYDIFISYRQNDNRSDKWVTKFIQAAQSVSNKLFFAGEATNVNGNFGTIHGSVETAERVVDEIVAVLEPA